MVDTGERIIYGKTPLNAAHAIPAAMREGFTAIVGGHIGVAAGLVKFRRRLDEVDDYAMWAVSAREKRIPDLTGLDAAGLHAVACEAIRSWHPDIRALLAAADVDETFLVRVRVSRRVAAWPSSRVTLLGDAIHAMSPARGSGANTALLDAAVLCAALTGKTTIDAYEDSMRTYGFASVEAADSPARPTAWGHLRTLLRRG
ncbi:FAD-dependent oxidoreductase [Actinoplanes sp. NPDC051513]|uniref:FAD-dependent oxidoreductase n=1 Tax=Actinoplanes sp. NPDC051513 TaxID=3363908 RepID=UPI0037AED441